MDKDIRNCLFISVKDLSKLMGVSLSNAYELIKRSDCPFNCVNAGKRILIPTNDFFRWYDGLLTVNDNEQIVEKSELSKESLETVENILNIK